MQRDTPHIAQMTRFTAPFLLCLSLGLAPALPVFGQTPPNDGGETRDEGLGLMERGLRLLFDGLMQDMEPALDDMAKALKEMEPMARELAGMIGDVQNYEPPVQLPNGDILIRRKAGAPPPKLPIPEANPPNAMSPDGQIEL
ncbi:AAA+ family ATPase [Pseudorhodobacter sp.]|uniref:AAA+ family ATPase n=1 Tax=Pseudorhodobacter sp. TaxID=1934400 RepID=UPI002647BB81|nr:AAA+ family ATPase [Pseudorhodobacter sp.]MDN5786049.1 AAA+ family ATPase [Pseudorhodobacter sp.]